MVGLLLMQDGKLDRLRLEGAKSAAKVLRVDEHGEQHRHSFPSVPVSDPQGIGIDVTDGGRWEGLVTEAEPPRECAEFVLGWAFYSLRGSHRSWGCATGTVAGGYDTTSCCLTGVFDRRGHLELKG